MAETRRKFDQDFKEGAVRLVRETGRPIAQVAKDLGINEGTLGNWVNADRRRRGEDDGALGEDERAELARLRKENGELTPRAARRELLAAEVRRLFAAHRGTYGSPRITADLREAGWRVSENTVTQLMREQHLFARAKKRRKSTTRPGKGRWRAPDLIGRDFPAQRLNQ